MPVTYLIGKERGAGLKRATKAPLVGTLAARRPKTKCKSAGRGRVNTTRHGERGSSDCGEEGGGMGGGGGGEGCNTSGMGVVLNQGVLKA